MQTFLKNSYNELELEAMQQHRHIVRWADSKPEALAGKVETVLPHQTTTPMRPFYDIPERVNKRVGTLRRRSRA